MTHTKCCQIVILKGKQLQNDMLCKARSKYHLKKKNPSSGRIPHSEHLFWSEVGWLGCRDTQRTQTNVPIYPFKLEWRKDGSRGHFTQSLYSKETPPGAP